MCLFSEIELCLQNNFPTESHYGMAMAHRKLQHIHGNIYHRKSSTNKTVASETTIYMRWKTSNLDNIYVTSMMYGRFQCACIRHSTIHMNVCLLRQIEKMIFSRKFN